MVQFLINEMFVVFRSLFGIRTIIHQFLKETYKSQKYCVTKFLLHTFDGKGVDRRSRRRKKTLQNLPLANVCLKM